MIHPARGGFGTKAFAKARWAEGSLAWNKQKLVRTVKLSGSEEIL